MSVMQLESCLSPTYRADMENCRYVQHTKTGGAIHFNPSSKVGGEVEPGSWTADAGRL